MRFLSIEPLLEDLGEIELRGIDWVIVGGESGAGARPMDEAWVVSLRRQCQAAGVPFFFKQWGGVRKSNAGRLLEGRAYDDMPPRPRVPSLPQRERQELISEVNIIETDCVLERTSRASALTHLRRQVVTVSVQCTTVIA